ncbi:MAG: 50S ribosomal protein L11 methyltransferase [Alphaproteobacteria bacterium]|jgi:ribosomal protein L11 methyltransferase|nr:50S ribosomal protein L11 methyltransferase [Alphaproteobacteria bacterium]
MPVCWKARAILPKREAQTLSDALEQLEPTPVVSAFELGERGLWEVEAFFAHEPDEADLLQRFGVPMRVIPIEDENWVARALEGLPPVQTQRFYIYGEHSAASVPANAIGLKIEASYAFGTGHHGTTRGCLLAYEQLAKRRTFRNALDLGCGTGVLGMAFARLAHKPVVATDIDPLATSKTIENAKLNRAQNMRVATANGFKTPLIAANAPYDLIFANILAGPLMRLMPGIKSNLSKGGHAILSGLLDEQANAITSMARAQNLRLIKRSALEGWITLILQRPWAAHGAVCPASSNCSRTMPAVLCP